MLFHVELEFLPARSIPSKCLNTALFVSIEFKQNLNMGMFTFTNFKGTSFHLLPLWCYWYIFNGSFSLKVHFSESGTCGLHWLIGPAGDGELCSMNCWLANQSTKMAQLTSALMNLRLFCCKPYMPSFIPKSNFSLKTVEL